MSHAPKKPSEPKVAGLHGYLAEYAKPAEVVHAAEAVRDAGFTRWDTFTPFPIHGMDGAMGIPMTRLPAIVATAGTIGCLTGLLLQWWTNAHDYQFLISGKPIWSLPANIPVTFELTVLFSAITTLVSMLVMNGLPQHSHPLDLKARFARSTDDRFFVLIESKDPKFDEESTWALLQRTQPLHLEKVEEDIRPSGLPKLLVYALVVVGVLSIVPFALITRARYSMGREPKLHVVPDMDWQPKVKAQKASTFFANGMGSRLPQAGTVARGDLREDDHLFRGLEGAKWATTVPAELTQDAPASLARGRVKFETFCAPCHGLLGQGDGMVAKRAASLKQGSWVPPSNLQQDYLRAMPVGQLFNTVTNGARNMSGYGAQIEPKDRWAIVMYVRALQKSRNVDVKDLPAEDRPRQ